MPSCRVIISGELTLSMCSPTDLLKMIGNARPTLSDMLGYIEGLTAAKLKECKEKGCILHILQAKAGDVVVCCASWVLVWQHGSQP